MDRGRGAVFHAARPVPRLEGSRRRGARHHPTGGHCGRPHRAAVNASGGDRRPWLPHLYLAHGIGVDSAEAPFIGTDLGDGFDETIVLRPGMVFVVEPIAWADGTGGYRGEEIVAVTDDGYQLLSDFPYAPYAA